MQVLEKSPVVFFNSNLSQCHVQEVGRGNIVYLVNPLWSHRNQTKAREAVAFITGGENTHSRVQGNLWIYYSRREYT